MEWGARSGWGGGASGGGGTIGGAHMEMFGASEGTSRDPLGMSWGTLVETLGKALGIPRFTILLKLMLL